MAKIIDQKRRFGVEELYLMAQYHQRYLDLFNAPETLEVSSLNKKERMDFYDF